MAKKPFDPFDERHRNKIKRRKPQEVAYENKVWNDRIDNHFRRALDIMQWPDYTDSNMLIMLAEYELNVTLQTLRRNFRASMERLGYEKFVNEKSKDGRWKVGDLFLVVYNKRGAPKIERSKLKQALDR